MLVEVLQLNEANGNSGNDNFGPIEHKYYNALAVRKVTRIVKNLVFIYL